MSKDVRIEVPTLNMEIRALPPNTPTLTFHLVAVPPEALAEVQEVLKKYQPQIDAIKRAVKKAQGRA